MPRNVVDVTQPLELPSFLEILGEIQEAQWTTGAIRDYFYDYRY